MKNLFLTLGAVAALTACGKSNAAEYEEIFVGCEQIQATDEHVVYKCPADMEWIVDVKTQEPNGKFYTTGGLNLADLYADTEHAYVEVSLNDPNTCKEDFTIRTMVTEPKDNTNWAFIGCK